MSTRRTGPKDGQRGRFALGECGVKQYIEQGAVRIGGAVQDLCANVDFEIVSLPGGSLIAILLSLYAIAMGYIRRAATTNYLFHEPCALGALTAGGCPRYSHLRQRRAREERESRSQSA